MGFFITTEAACVYTYICIYVHTHTYIRIHPSGIKLWPYLVLVPLLLPKQLLPVEACTPLDPLRCAVVSGIKVLRADPYNIPASQHPKLWSGPPWIRVCKTHRCLIGLISVEFGGQVNTSNSLLCSPSFPEPFFALWNVALSRWKRPQRSGNSVSLKECTLSATMLR